MRQALQVTGSTLPAYALTQPELAAITAHMHEWKNSDFAGFRRVLQKGDAAQPDLARIRTLADSRRAGVRDFVILGIGGSSLGAEAMVRALHSPLKEPRFHVADNSDPTVFRWLLDGLKPAETLFYVVAKSGSTPETLSQFLVARDWLANSLGGEAWKKHFVLCTDPVRGDLRTLANRWQLDSLEVPSAVGGRFTALTPVGLFPAAFAGLAIEEFMAGAASVEAWGEKWDENPCAQVGIALAKAGKKHPLTVLMPYSSQLSAFSRWFCQLWGESLGKNGVGLTPYPAVGATDQHSQMQLYMEGPKDKCLVFVHAKSTAGKMPIPFPQGIDDLTSFSLLKGRSVGALLDAEFRATRDAVTQAGIPNCTLEVDTLDAYSLGALLYFWEIATAVAGATLGVNPFDQPGVEAAKILTKKYLAQ
ncbi:MAG: glucose-6-phosphate isomerase [Bdellovibrionota bacterium]